MAGKPLGLILSPNAGRPAPGPVVQIPTRYGCILGVYIVVILGEGGGPGESTGGG